MRIGIADNITVAPEIATALDRTIATLEKLGLSMPLSIAFTDLGKGIAAIERDRQAIQPAAFKDIDGIEDEIRRAIPPRFAQGHAHVAIARQVQTIDRDRRT